MHFWHLLRPLCSLSGNIGLVMLVPQAGDIAWKRQLRYIFFQAVHVWYCYCAFAFHFLPLPLSYNIIL